jgi:hypothetical protein
MEKITSSRSTSIAVGGALVALIGTFLTWATVTAEWRDVAEAAGESTSINAWSEELGDGVLVLFAAIVLAVVAVTLKDRARMITMTIMGALIIFIVVVDIVDIMGNDSDLLGEAVDVYSVGYGLWVTLLGGVAGLGAAFLKD